MHHFTVHALRSSQVHTAFPLIRDVLPSVDLKAWSRFARKTTNPKYANRSGIVVAVSASRPHPSGLATYRKEDDLRFGQVLTVSHFVAFDLLDRQPVAAALIAAMESMGRSLRCNTLRWHLTQDAKGAMPKFIETGHGIAGTVFYKYVTNDACDAARIEVQAAGLVSTPS